MAYESNRDSQEDDIQKEEAVQKSADDLRRAADIAASSKNPYAIAASGAFNAADWLTGGKSTKALAGGLSKANELLPGDKKLRDLLNKNREQALNNAAGRAANPNNEVAGGQGGPPSSGDTQSKSSSVEKDDAKDSDESSEDTKKGRGLSRFIGGSVITTVFIWSLPVFFIFIIFFAAISTVSGLFGDYEDAIGMSSTLNEENGGIVFSASSPDQQNFYNRTSEVKTSYQAKGKNVDANKVAATYHVLNNNGAGLKYDDMTTEKIEEIADAMIDNNSYNEENFKQNLVNKIIPSYVNGLSKEQREEMANEIIDYTKRYDNLVGRESSDSNSNICGGTTSCKYNIKGYYINKKGNIKEGINVDNLYVRLMQCGTVDGHNYGGTFGKPLEEEDIIPFEKYILGVTYLEIGNGAENDATSAEAYKAQIVAARSYVLARHADMGGWRTLKKEGDKWILQVASCTIDPVYCDPDKGCSSNNTQWSMIYSGSSKAKKLRNPLSQDSNLRKYASQTAGEVLVNDLGYIISSGYKKDDQNQMIALSKSGLNYKRILLQIYNQGSRNYGAKDVIKNSCTTVGGTTCASGPYAQWKQRGQSWSNIQLGNSGRTIGQIGCLVTSVSMLIAKSGVPTNISGEFNPGSFVTYLNSHGGFNSDGEFMWGSVSSVAPSWKYQGKTSLSGLTKDQKLAKIKEIISQPNTYAVVEVKGITGQHWVAIDSVSGSTVNMMDPSTNSTDMWGQYNWVNTSVIASFKVS